MVTRLPRLRRSKKTRNRLVCFSFRKTNLFFEIGGNLIEQQVSTRVFDRVPFVGNVPLTDGVKNL